MLVRERGKSGVEKREVKIAYTQAKQKCHARNRAYIALTTEPMIDLLNCKCQVLKGSSNDLLKDFLLCDKVVPSNFAISNAK